MVRADGGSAANELIVMGGHAGTHVDALCHVSQDGQIFGGKSAERLQKGGLFSELGVETIPLMFCRGVMLDIPSLLNVEVLEPGMAITAAHLGAAATRQGIDVIPGDAVLIRSGWERYWSEPPRFLGTSEGAPGPDEGAAQWLSARGVRLTGGETIAYECIRPGVGHSLLPVHKILLVDHGIYIVEALNLAELARDLISTFLFVLTPIRAVGATGIPVRPVAIVG